MNVGEMKDILAGMDDDKEIRVALRQAFNTLEYTVHIGESDEVVYFGTGDQIGYASDEDIEW